jgi:hypothetical protein
VLDTTLCDEVSQWGAFLRVVRFPPPIKLTRHDIAEILLKVALNTINQRVWNALSHQLQLLNKYNNVSGVNPTTKRSRPRLPIYSKPATGF